MSEHDPFEEGPQPGLGAPPPHKTDLGDVDDAMRAGTPGAKFDKIGRVYQGEIVSATMAHQRDMNTGKPLFWDDGNPKTQILIIIQTSERDDNIEDDDGKRTLYVKNPGGMRSAIAKALGKIKLSEAVGGTLAVKYTGDGEPTKRGFNAPKLFAAKFTPAGGVAAAPVVAGVPDNMAARQACWAAFKLKTSGLTEGARKSAWLQMMAAKLPGQDAKTMSAADLNQLAVWIAASYSLETIAPSEMPDESIPF